MKKLLLSAALLVAGTASAFAQQKGEFTVGANVSYLTDGAKWTGIGAKARYGLTEQFRLEGGVNYFLPKYNTSGLELAANVHYVVPLDEKISVYPLAGLGYFSSHTSVAGFSASHGEFLINLGGGASYQLNDKLSFGAELKYMLVDGYNTPSIGVNAMFSL